MSDDRWELVQLDPYKGHTPGNDHFYIVLGMNELKSEEQETRQPRPGSMVHFHRSSEPCNDRCYGVVINGRARTLEGTIQGTGV